MVNIKSAILAKKQHKGVKTMKKLGIVPNFVIAGVSKSATSSVFTYLNAHPQVCGSSLKETAFFIKDYKGDHNADLKSFSKYFKHRRRGEKILMESTPRYMRYGREVASRIKTVLPNVKLMFLLRNPIDRLYSHYNFRKARFDFDENMTFDEYVEKCMLYTSGLSSPEEQGLKEEHLLALEIGRYAQYIKEYYEFFPRERVKIMFQENLKKYPVVFMTELCDFLNIDSMFYNSYTFDKVNATFTGKIKILHRIAVIANDKLERFLRQRQKIKKKIVVFYKYLNQKNEGYQPMLDTTRARLIDYYRSSNNELTKLLPGVELPLWE